MLVGSGVSVTDPHLGRGLFPDRAFLGRAFMPMGGGPGREPAGSGIRDVVFLAQVLPDCRVMTATFVHGFGPFPNAESYARLRCRSLCEKGYRGGDDPCQRSKNCRPSWRN